MNKNELMMQLRKKKLGLLIYDARSASHRSVEDCAAAIGVDPEQFTAFEKGMSSPSLPELENLSFYLEIPLEHFWGDSSLNAYKKPENINQKEQLRRLRDRLIGASLRISRQKLNKTTAEIAQSTSIPEENLLHYEAGEMPVPLIELELLSKTLEGRVEDFFDQKGPVGKWRNERMESQQFIGLPAELRSFVVKPVNRPYLELAVHLSELQAEKLRRIAEALLEITF